jgi:hypothetical protein
MGTDNLQDAVEVNILGNWGPGKYDGTWTSLRTMVGLREGADGVMIEGGLGFEGLLDGATWTGVHRA